MNKDKKDYAVACVKDLVTATDPFASSKEAGQDYVGSLLDLINASRGLGESEYADLVKEIEDSYKNY